MKPESGDASVVVTAADVRLGLNEVGVGAGDVVLFHSSLSSMGTVDGGANAVIQGFLGAVGPRGTVAVPTLCNWAPGEEDQVFTRWNPRSSPSYVGLITDTFWRRPDARRSDHATHSVAAIGARARELTADHGGSGRRPGPFGDRAFARESPWQRLVDWNAAYCFIGVSFQVATIVHLVETLLVERALGRPRAPAGEMAEEISDWRRPGVWPTVRVEDREVIEGLLADRGLVRYGRIGSATLRCVRMEPLVEGWVGILEGAPERWLPDPYLRWWRQAAGGVLVE